VVVRSYDHSSQSGLFDDFFLILGIAPGTLNFDRGLRAHRRPLAADLLKAFCANRKGAPLNAAENAVVEVLCGSTSGSALGISPRLSSAIESAFRESNARVFRRYGLPFFDAAGTAQEPTGSFGEAPSVEACSRTRVWSVCSRSAPW
jgi:hypothetical protein